jgi:hypothetical protein
MPRKKKTEEVDLSLVNLQNEDVLVDANFYKGNENLLRGSAQIKWTPAMIEEIKNCNKKISHFAEKYFYIVTEDGKEKISLYKYQKQLLKAFVNNRFNVVLSSRQSGKALCLNTPIPTPNGFVNMGNLKDGDNIYGLDGKVYTITKAHDVLYNRECYKVTFDNGEEIIADAEHLWYTQTKTDRKRKKNKEGNVKTTKDIFHTLLTKDKEPNHRIPMCLNGIEHDKKELPINPYILGLWLGDGATDGSRITIGKRDIEDTLKILENNEQFKILKVQEDKRGVFALNLTNEKRKVDSLHTILRLNNLLGNKHIPEFYFLSSREQRIELLMGLMDSDGYITPKGHAYFYNTNLNLVKEVQKLITSLGYKAFYKEKIAKINGVECGLVGSVYFKPREMVVKLPFKADRLKNNLSKISDSNRNQFHYIKDIQKIESVPVRCITVDSPDSLYLCGNTLIPTHNTTTITIYALWMVCFQSEKRITIVANKEDTAKEIFSRIRMSFEELPIWMKPSVKSWRKDGFELENGSRITVSSTSSAGPRGSTSNLLIIDEMAHCPNDLMKELWKSAIPIISSMKRSQLVVISTPNGVDNKFFELVEQAKKPDSEWHLETVNWWDVPGRDEEWKKEATDAIGSKEDFDQEYGNVFHQKGKTAIDPELLEQLKAQCKEPVLVMDNGAYKVFEAPNPESFYAIGVDVGEGIGRSNTVAQILDFSDLTNIKQVAIYSTNQMSPFHFGTRLMGILDDWGRPPILVENNNNGQQVLDVLCHTHNYESVVSYHFDGFSKHYNKENRFGIHNHTNTRYRGVTNFRYWANSLKALALYDMDTLLELTNFVRHPNFTFSKRNDSDMDDRVLSLIWGLFILDPAIANKYFNIIETDDQGRPLKMKPLIDNRDLIKKSPIFYGQVSNFKKNPIITTAYSFVGKFEVDKPITESSEAESLMNWLVNWDDNTLPPPLAEPIKPDNQDKKDKLLNGEEYYPTIVF